MSTIREVDPRPPVATLSESVWALSLSGVRTVFMLELRQRVRSRWWAITIAIWFAVLLGLTALIYATVSDENNTNARAGALMFGVVSILVLSLAALVSPALSATSINGDRAQGVLAALQSTLLTPAEVVVGKLLAAWTSALSLLAAAVPFFVWAFVLGGTSGRRLITTLVMIALSLLVVCAMGLGCSALVNRTAASAAQTYLLVALLGLGLPLLFALSLTVVNTEKTELRPQVNYLGMDADGTERTSCTMELTPISKTHTEYTWWLLAASPYVVVADASPRTASYYGDDILGEIRSGVRSARLGPAPEPMTCAELTDYNNGTGYEEFERQRRLQEDQLPAAWPYGLGIDLLIGAAFTVLAIRRIRVPAMRLPRGTRVA